MEDENDFTVIKMGKSICIDDLVIEAIKDASSRASKIGYLASTYLRHFIYSSVVNDRTEQMENILFPVTERSLVRFWNEVCKFL